MNIKKILSVIFALVLMLSVFPLNAFALDTQMDESVAGNTDPESSDDEALIEKLLGDADLNDTVNVKDATLIQKQVAGISTIDEIQFVFADADRSGAVNVKDATAIQKFVAGIKANCTDIGKPFVANPETYRYYFYMPEEWLNKSTDTTGNTAGIYWWDDINRMSCWPGIPAKKGDIEGVYYYDVPKDVTTIIWNNYFDGGADPSASYYSDAHLTVEIGTEFYEAGESEWYPEGLTSFDNMIYVIDPDLHPWDILERMNQSAGEWFYYYGNGEYGTSPVKGDGEIYSGSAFNRDEFVPY